MPLRIGAGMPTLPRASTVSVVNGSVLLNAAVAANCSNFDFARILVAPCASAAMANVVERARDRIPTPQAVWYVPHPRHTE